MSSSKSPSSRRKWSAKAPIASIASVPRVNNRSNDISGENSFSGAKYRALFNEIDSDNSGFIDSEELFICISKIFPSSQVTRRNVDIMMSNADTNGDGKISFDEFVRILYLQAGSDSLWGRAEKSLWAKFRRGIDESIGFASDIIESTAEPLREIMRKNSYLSPDGKLQIAGAGSRFTSNIIHLFAVIVYFLIFGFIFVNTFPYKPEDIIRNNQAAIYGIRSIRYFLFFTFISFSFIELLLWSKGRTLSMWLWGLKCVDKDTGRTFGFNEMLKAKWLYLLQMLLSIFINFELMSVPDNDYFEALNTLQLKYYLPTQILLGLTCLDSFCVFAYDGATLLESMAGAQVIVRPAKTVQIKGN